MLGLYCPAGGECRRWVLGTWWSGLFLRSWGRREEEDGEEGEEGGRQVHAMGSLQCTAATHVILYISSQAVDGAAFSGRCAQAAVCYWSD